MQKRLEFSFVRVLTLKLLNSHYFPSLPPVFDVIFITLDFSSTLHKCNTDLLWKSSHACCSRIYSFASRFVFMTQQLRKHEFMISSGKSHQGTAGHDLCFISGGQFDNQTIEFFISVHCN